jgi:membrane protein
MFVAFFPSLLFALGVLSFSGDLPHAGRALLVTVRLVFPTGTSELLSSFLTSRGLQPWKLIALSLSAMLLAGSQVMVALSEGVRMIDGMPEPPGFVRRQVRAFSLLLITMAPWLTVVILTVFGRQLRGWLIQRFGSADFLRIAGALAYFAVVMALGFGVLLLFYHRSLLRRHDWGSLVPGAILATVLWWVVDVSLGLYFLHVPYRVVYGRMAAAIGLLIWMYSTSLVVFLGAAYNAEVFAERETPATNR